MQKMFQEALDLSNSEGMVSRISELEIENKKLKDLVSVLMEAQEADFKRLSPLDEEYICEIEISKIKKRVNSFNRELSLDDVKKLETLWKVKKSIKDDRLNNEASNIKSSLPEELTGEEIKLIAATDSDMDSDVD